MPKLRTLSKIPSVNPDTWRSIVKERLAEVAVKTSVFANENIIEVIYHRGNDDVQTSTTKSPLFVLYVLPFEHLMTRESLVFFSFVTIAKATVKQLRATATLCQSLREISLTKSRTRTFHPRRPIGNKRGVGPVCGIARTCTATLKMHGKNERTSESPRTTESGVRGSTERKRHLEAPEASRETRTKPNWSATYLYPRPRPRHHPPTPIKTTRARVSLRKSDAGLLASSSPKVGHD